MMSQNFISLTRDQLRRDVPAIFAEHGSHKTSARYSHISTLEVVDALEREGYLPVKAMQSRSRIEENKGFAKHLIRFRHVNAIATVGSGLFPELVLTNSHDGLSSYKLQNGLYRLVCSNGMVAGKTFNEVRVKHQGDIVGNVIEGTYTVMGESEKLIDASQRMGSVQLSQDEQKAFARAVHEIYFDGNESPLVQAIEPEKFLRVRRTADRAEDLFTVFNRAQENAIRGGLSGYYQDPKRGYVRTTTREIKSIDKNTALNRALWTLAEEMAKLKGAA